MAVVGVHCSGVVSICRTRTCYLAHRHTGLSHPGLAANATHAHPTSPTARARRCVAAGSQPVQPHGRASGRCAGRSAVGGAAGDQAAGPRAAAVVAAGGRGGGRLQAGAEAGGQGRAAGARRCVAATGAGGRALEGKGGKGGAGRWAPGERVVGRWEGEGGFVAEGRWRGIGRECARVWVRLGMDVGQRGCRWALGQHSRATGSAASATPRTATGCVDDNHIPRSEQFMMRLTKTSIYLSNHSS